jgi:hypothetical protein
VKSRTTLWLGLATLAGCGGIAYTPPAPARFAESSVVVPLSRSDAWKAIIPTLGKSFFVVNNLDQSSGFINVSYSGDPEQYVDCGAISSTVKNAQGERSYTFPASRARQSYEMVEGARYYTVLRLMALEGRANLVLEEIAKDSSRFTVTVRYALTKTTQTQGSAAHSEVVSFNTAGMATFANQNDTMCRPTGLLEHELLALSGVARRPTQ